MKRSEVVCGEALTVPAIVVPVPKTPKQEQAELYSAKSSQAAVA